MTADIEVNDDIDEPGMVDSLLVGLPRTGKTSYLGLLFVSLVGGEPNDLTLEAYGQDYAYLSRIAKRLQEFETAAHTEVGEGDGLNLVVKMPSGDSRALLVPDLSGETWESAHVEGVLDQEIADHAASAAGIMLFMNLTSFRRDATVPEARAAVLAVGADEDDWCQEAMPVAGPGVSPTQVALVDLIQIVMSQRTTPVRLSLMLSAYDTATESVTPGQWVASNMPLVDQYLDANDATVASRVFGVSAQGGIYLESPTAGQSGPESVAGSADRAMDLLERAFVLNEQGEHVRPHEPLVWALGDG